MYVLRGRLSPRAHALVVEWASLHADELRADWELATSSLPLMRIAPLRQHPPVMLRVRSAIPLEGRGLRLTLTDGTVVERDIADLLWGPVFDRLRTDDAFFRRVRARYGTVTWPADGSRRPEPFLRPRSPGRSTRQPGR